MNVPTHYQKQIKSFENAYVRKQKALDKIKEIHNQIAEECGYSDYSEMCKEFHKSNSKENFWQEFNRISIYYSELAKNMRILKNANNTLNRTKGAYWNFHPKGTPKVMAFGKLNHCL